MTIKHILTNPQLVIGGMIVLAFAIVALAAPLIAPPEGEDPYLIPRDGFSIPPQPPSQEHPLGTMQNQYDVLYGLVWGARVAFRIGLLITLGRALIGIMVGVVSGYTGGWLDGVLMRITDAFMAFPIIAVVVVMVTLFGGGGIGIQTADVERLLTLTLTLFGWMQYARLVRGNVLAERAKEYVKAAISIGARDRRIIFRHVLPNSTQGLFVLIASDIGAMVVTVAALTFVGLAGNDMVADWGLMLQSSRNWIIGTPSNAFEFWYTYLLPSLAIVFFSIGWNLIGDGLREATDPRTRGLYRSRR